MSEPTLVKVTIVRQGTKDWETLAKETLPADILPRVGDYIKFTHTGEPSLSHGSVVTKVSWDYTWYQSNHGSTLCDEAPRVEIVVI